MHYADFYRRSIEDREGFWAEQATLIDWQRPFDTACDDSRPPSALCTFVVAADVTEMPMGRHRAACLDPAGQKVRLAHGGCGQK